MNSFDHINFNLNYNNFNPEDIQVDETINAVFVVDVSPSIHTFVDDLNAAFNDFIASMQNSHIADSLMVSIIEFNELVSVKSGFMPVMNLQKHDFSPSGSGTALYDATAKGIEVAMDYRKNLEASGVTTKTLLFVITDGGDNSSHCRANEVKKRLENIASEESNLLSFVSILFGIGDRHYFEAAQQDMGIQHLASIGKTADEIKKMISFISRSISNSAANTTIQF